MTGLWIRPVHCQHPVLGLRWQVSNHFVSTVSGRIQVNQFISWIAHSENYEQEVQNSTHPFVPAACLLWWQQCNKTPDT